MHPVPPYRVNSVSSSNGANGVVPCIGAPPPQAVQCNESQANYGPRFGAPQLPNQYPVNSLGGQAIVNPQFRVNTSPGSCVGLSSGAGPGVIPVPVPIPPAIPTALSLILCVISEDTSSTSSSSTSSNTCACQCGCPSNT